MSLHTHYENFVHKHLDPASRLGEILFGLIMVLTVTLTAGLTVAEGKAGVRQLLEAALGCNLAWGIIDAVMYIMNSITERTGQARLIKEVQGAPNQQAAFEVLRNQLDPELELLTSPVDRETLYRGALRHLSHSTAPETTRMTREDFYGALACFWLVFVSCLPAAIPFLIFSNPSRALRISNALLIALLFFVGYKWAKYAGTRRILTGLIMVGIGLVLVGVAILLGG